MSVAADHVAVCFGQAWRLALVSVVRCDLCVRRQDAGMPAVYTAETITGIDVGCVAWVWRSRVAQLF